MTRYDWQALPEPDDQKAHALATTLSVPVFVAKLLLQRGITDQASYDAFSKPDLSRLHDPFLLHDMAKAVARIQQAVQKSEKITIYGDYDVDGLTSTSIMLETLQSIGAEPEVFIPDRFTDGYGPNATVYSYLEKSGTQLVITVDNGVAGADVIDAAMQNGLDVIVTDHHELPEKLPQAVAVVHPRYPGTKYPFGDLSGAGVAFKVATALLDGPPVESIDLAALGTIADIVSLTNENRIFVQMGLQLIRQQPRVGLAALLKAASIDPKTVDETSVGFGIAPRLNALGRMGDATPGVKLLTTFEDDVADELAAKTETLNQQRQQLVKSIAATALQMAQTPENQARKTLIIANAGWHEGVLGIVASRIVETTGKPTLVLNISEDGQTAKGSGRSVKAFHLYNALAPVRDQMTHFGGHHMAVGLTVPVDHIPALQAAMEKAAVSLNDQVKPPLPISLSLTHGDISLANYQALRALAPFGSGNPEPTFTYRPTRLDGIRQIGQTADHLKLQADGVDVIGFGFGDQAGALKAANQVKLAVNLAANTWQGNTTVQLQLKDLQLKRPDIIDMRLPQPSAEQFRGAYTYVFFDQKVMRQLTHQFQFGGPTVLATSLAPSTENVVLVDLPPDEGALAAAVANVTLPLRIIFYASPAHLVALPTRRECGGVLRYLAEHRNFDKHHLPALAKAVHLTVGQVILAVQMFFELGFVKIDGALISVVTDPVKKSLDQAPAYQARVTFLTLAKALQTESRTQLEARLLKA